MFSFGDAQNLGTQLGGTVSETIHSWEQLEPVVQIFREGGKGLKCAHCFYIEFFLTEFRE